MTGTPREGGNIASVPYTNWYGGMPISLLVLNLSAQSEKTSLLCQEFLFYSNVFLRIFTRILFEESASPFLRVIGSGVS
jgi:hypothetical protein